MTPEYTWPPAARAAARYWNSWACIWNASMPTSTSRCGRAKTPSPTPSGWPRKGRGRLARVSSCGLPERPLLAADTTVSQDGEIFGKPEDADDARRMLRAFSGRSHQAITSVAVRDGGKLLVKTSITDVFFKSLSDAEIERYIASGEPFDKAGAYGIQGKAGVFVEHIEGSYTGVMGLPVHETALLLAEFGFELP
ncbi:Maf-like protein yhdE [Chromobacterium violaceum]|uniref:Nucleoside triphosphate pyrophosphatase n=1 Tax=Chromobacterium violaceum TaxID=536 RepID=A0A3S4LDI6_CHRVL|nr:Maf-like protein yhdE [Chromobacterium violaceum]